MAFAAGFSGGYGAVAGAREARRLAAEREEERRRQEEERRRKLGLLEALPETMGSYIGAQEAGRSVEVPIESQAMGLEAGLPPVTRTAQPWASTAEMLRESPQARQAAAKFYQATEGKWPWEAGGPLEPVEVARERTEKRQRQQETRALAGRALDLLESPDDDDKVQGWYLMRRVDVLRGEASKKWVEEGIQGTEEGQQAKNWVTKTYAPYQAQLAQEGRTTAEQDLAFLRDTFPVAMRVPAVADELKVWSQRFRRDRDPAVQAGGRYTELRLQGRDHRSAMAQVMRENPDGWLQMLTLGEEYVPAALKPHLTEAFQTEREREKEETERKTKGAQLRRAEAEATRAERGVEAGAEPKTLAEAQRMLSQAMKSLESLRYADPEDRPELEEAAKSHIAYLNDWIRRHQGGAGAAPGRRGGGAAPEPAHLGAAHRRAEARPGRTRDHRALRAAAGVGSHDAGSASARRRGAVPIPDARAEEARAPGTALIMDLWRFFADDPSDPAAEPAGGPTREELDALFAPPETGIEMTIPPPIAVNVEEED